MKKISIVIFLIGVMKLNAQNKPIQNNWLQTTGKLPSITFSLGEDRLGSPKMGYIDTNVLVNVVDSISDNYKVQLSSNHSGYISKLYTKSFSTSKLPICYSTKFIVSGTDSGYDKLSIALDERIPYRSYMEINPSKIILLLYGVQSNTNWITQLHTAKEIKNVYYNQLEDDLIQVTIELVHHQHWGYSIGYNGKFLELKVKQQPKVVDIHKLKIAIDAGHGGSNVGAEGVNSKVSEKIYTLQFANELKKALHKMGVKNVFMTRTKDTAIEMKDRILLLQQQQPDLLLSIHLNSSTDPNTSGTSTYYRYIGFRPLSQTILKRMFELKLNDYGNVGNFNFGLNGPTDCINTLLEVGFLSNPDEEKKLMNPMFQKKVALQVIKGINDWLLTSK